MAKCDVESCEELLQYLPFKCKYCGGTFCKNHRLPENHNCDFTRDFSTPKVVTPPAQSQQKEPIHSGMYSDAPAGEAGDDQIEKEIQDYLRKQQRNTQYAEREERNRERNERVRRTPSRGRSMFNANGPTGFSMGGEFQATKWLMGLTAIFFLLGFFLHPYLMINLFNVGYIIPIFTAPLIIASGFMGIITLIFSLLILWGIGRQLEMKMGSKFLLKLYFVAGWVAVGTVLTVQMLDYSMLQLGYFLQLASTQNAAIMGLLTFYLYLVGLEREMRFYLYFIPVRLKGKHILIGILILNIVFAFLGSVESFGTIAGMFIGKKYYESYQRNMHDMY